MLKVWMLGNQLTSAFWMERGACSIHRPPMSSFSYSLLQLFLSLRQKGLVDQIFQKFERGDESGHGTVRNVLKWSIPRLLEEQEGATLIVSAKFSVISSRNIYLDFEEVTTTLSLKRCCYGYKKVPWDLPGTQPWDVRDGF